MGALGIDVSAIIISLRLTEFHLVLLGKIQFSILFRDFLYCSISHSKLKTISKLQVIKVKLFLLIYAILKLMGEEK